MKIIMYHYVQEYDPEFPNFYYLDFKNFKKQLDYFEEKYGFVTPEEWSKFIGFGIPPKSQSKILLTFDDGLTCHYNFVFKELKKRGLWGIFYVPTFPLVSNEILDVHLIHLLIGKYEPSLVLLHLRSLINNSMIPDSKISAFKEMTYIRQVNSDEVTLIKRILNYFIGYSYKKDVLQNLCSLLGFNRGVNGFYLTAEQLIEMQKSGMIIGSHTHSHPLMSKLSYDEQTYEITKSIGILKDLGIKDSQRTYCHPYGGKHSYDNNTLTILQKNKISYSFDFNPIDLNIHLESIQALPRYDCNQFPFGSVSNKK